ncbi:MAG: aminoacyl-histidine dipeptidase, partial [Butyricicoccus sp.]|nr:aminoacyl-histidine dipeptidase [Butyricicoccus sp.]
MAVLGHLEPRGVFSFFEQMCAIPHGSFNTRQISDWLASFAKERGLEHHQDAVGNVIIIKEATPGYEHAAPIIFQGHMDMVCEKAADCTKDMETEGLDLAIDGDAIY